METPSVKGRGKRVSLYECVRLALGSLRANKMRSALTLLGIVIGIASVITMMSMGEGARKLVTGEFVGMGANLIFVQQDYTRQEVLWGHVKPLTIEDADFIRRACPAVADVSVTKVGPAVVKYGAKRQNVNATFTDDGLSSTQGGILAEGRLLTELDVRARRPVVVLGGGLARKLFEGKNPVGEKVKINGLSFVVVGVMKEQGRTIFGDNTADMSVYLPISHARRMTGNDDVAAITVEAADVAHVKQATDQVSAVLARRYGEDPPFMVISSSTMLKSAETVMSIFTVILAGIGSISLLVGGIGVMNIMLVSVTERTREIGIRKAVGAKRGDILRQFIVEAVALCLAGGAIGTLLGSGGAALVAKLAKWPTYVSPLAVFVAFFSATAVGLVFGVYPAYKAANLDPIEALRYE